MSMHAWNFARTLNWSSRAELVDKLYQEVLTRTGSVRERRPENSCRQHLSCTVQDARMTATLNCYSSKKI